MAALTHSLTEEQDRGSERAGEVPVLMRTRRPAILRCHQDALRARDEGSVARGRASARQAESP
jgi:hypothetical protein